MRAIVDGLRQILDAYDGGMDSYLDDEDGPNENTINYSHSDDEDERLKISEKKLGKAKHLDEMAHRFE